MTIPGWTDVTNSFELVTDSFTHSTRTGVGGYVVGGPFASSEIEQTADIPDGYMVGAIAVLTFKRANVGNTDDTGRVYLEALDDTDAVLDSESTDLELFSTENVWVSRRLVMTLPDGATKLRTRLLANRSGVSGNSAAAFDDFACRVHKQLDPQHVVDLSFTERPPQPTPRNWQRWHLAWPNATALVDCVVAQGELAVSAPRPISGESIVWSDGVGNDAIAFLGNFSVAASDRDVHTSGTYRRAFRFVYQGPHLQLVGNGTKRRGAFELGSSFAVRVVLKARQHGAGAGICGCRDTTSGIGWGLSLTATGAVRATLQGVDGAKTATSSASIADGAPHQVVMVYSAADETLRIYVDRRGYVETSTSSAMGEFALPQTLATVVRIGTDRSGTDVFGGELLELDLIPTGDSVMSEAEVEAMWPYCAVDSVEMGLSHVVWVPQEPAVGVGGVGPPSIDADTTLVRCAVDQLAYGYAEGEHGLAITGPTTNLWPSNDPASTGAFVAESTVTLTRAIIDNTGLAFGLRVTGDATHGLRITPTNFGASATKANVIVFARATSGTPSLEIAALNASATAVDTESLALTTSWKMFRVTLDWAGSASGSLRFRSASVFEISCVGFAAPFSVALSPSVIQDAGVSLSSVHATVSESHPLQLNHEGELDITGVATLATPALDAIVGVLATALGNFDRRHLLCAASAVPRFTHWEGLAASAVNADASAIDWTDEWRLRGRWNRLGIPTATADTFAGIVVTGSVDTDNQDARNATFDVTTNPIVTTEIGASSGDSLDAYIRRFAVRAREPRLG